MKPLVISLLACCNLSALVYGQQLVYTLKPGEKVIMENEHRLLAFNNAFYHLLFTGRGDQKYVIFNGKEFGQFKEISFSESAVSLLDWAVQKEDGWYQLILDKGVVHGPYEWVSDVFRNENPTLPSSDHRHYGFRASRGAQYFVVIDGKELGPYPEVDQGTPVFSEDGTNWAFSYWDEQSKTSVVVSARSTFKTHKAGYMNFWKNELRMVGNAPGGSFVYRTHSDSITLKGSGFYSNLTQKCTDGTVAKSESFEVKQVIDESGKVLETFNDMSVNANSRNMLVTALKVTALDPQGNIINTDGNRDKYPDTWNLCSFQNLPFVEKVKKEYYLIFNGQTMGPFTALYLYGSELSNNSDHFLALDPKEGRIIIDGKPGTTTGVQSFDYNPVTHSVLRMMKTGDLYFNDERIGNFGVNIYAYFSGNNDNFSFTYQKDGKDWIYVSSIRSGVGPFEEIPNIAFSDDGKHWGYCLNRTIKIDNQVKAQNAFDLVYDPVRKSFKWITLRERQIFLNELRMP